MVSGETFYCRVEGLCAERNITMARYAKDTDLSSGVPSSWKRGVKPSPGTIKRTSLYFNVSVSYLRGETEDRGTADLKMERISKEFSLEERTSMLFSRESYKENQLGIAFDAVYRARYGPDWQRNLGTLKIKPQSTPSQSECAEEGETSMTISESEVLEIMATQDKITRTECSRDIEDLNGRIMEQAKTIASQQKSIDNLTEIIKNLSEKVGHENILDTGIDVR